MAISQKCGYHDQPERQGLRNMTQMCEYDCDKEMEDL